MKNVQFIDGADNCSYDVFSLTEEEFLILFPEKGQDIEFIEEVIERFGDAELGKIMKPIWRRKVKKPEIIGIHGTIFYELLWKKKYYPTKKSSEMTNSFV